MSDTNDLDLGPPSIDPYEVLGLERDASADHVKTAYRKAALKNHPDKVTDEDKDAAKERFQQIAFAYAILSDPTRRKRYDTTGSTEDSIIDSDDFNWSDYYREQYKDAISSDAIAKFSAKYKGSDEEKDDVLAAYDEFKGDMDELFSTVMLSDPIEDEERFQKIIREAIDAGEVEGYPAFLKESKKKKKARRKRAEGEGEAAEAMEHAKELGIHDKLFGGGKKTKASNSGDDLAALIQKRQAGRAAGGAGFLDRLAEKYGAGSGSGAGKKGKRAADDEPDEAAFQATAARMKAAKDARAGNTGQSKKKKTKD